MQRRVLPVVLAALVTVVLLLPAAGPAATPASYPSCGMYAARGAPPIPAAHRRVNACIVDAARDGRHARAVIVRGTVEGDPIVSYYFVRGPKDVLLVADATRDRYGPRVWLRFRCDRLHMHRGYVGQGRCVEFGKGKPRWLKPIRLPR